MGRPKAWFWGLIPLAVLLLGAIFFAQTSVEQRLTSAGTSALASSGYPWAKLALSGRDAILTGEAPDLDAQTKAATMADQVFGIRKVADTTTIKPPRIPYAFGALRGDKTITLTGTVPDAATRSAIVAAATKSFAGLTIDDKLSLRADEVPAGFAATVSAKLADMGKLAPGARLALTDQQVSLTGDLLPRKPYVFNALRGQSSITLEGTVPDAATKTSILALIKTAFEGDNVDDKLSIRLDEVPAGFAGAVSAHLADLARLAPGASLSISDKTVALKGAAAYENAKEQIAAQFRRLLPTGFTGTVEVSVAPPAAPVTDGPECQLLYKDALTRGTIRFKVAAADINPDSYALLDRLAVVTLRCTNAKIEIGGHTDSDGSAEANLDLSRRRAEAVAAFMVKAGAPASRLEPVGHGASQPLVANDSAENKARNRRIEFNVK